jgi:hypothetical protein
MKYGENFGAMVGFATVDHAVQRSDRNWIDDQTSRCQSDKRWLEHWGIHLIRKIIKDSSIVRQ